MPLFAVIGLDHPPHSMDKRNAVRAEHRSYVLGHAEPIALVGPFLDEAGNQCGSFYIFDAKDEQEIRDWLKSEPFCTTDVYRDVIIRRFEPGMNRLPVQDWPNLTAAGSGSAAATTKPTTRTSRQLVHDFFAAVTAGDLPDSLLTPDMKAWTTTQGTMEKAQYQRVINILAEISARPLTFTIDSITTEEDRAVAELHSEGTLINGEDYSNTYVFVFRIRDGRIASVAEHFNALIVQEKMMPLVQGKRGLPQ
jgi:ketosteroid isomerase-like protein/uncharacterized protein YciI